MQELVQVLQMLRLKAVDSKITFHPPASSALIDSFEKALGMSLPEDFRMLYQHCNGFTAEEDYFCINTLEEVMDRKEILGKGEFIFAEYMIYCDSWKLQISAPPENHYFICDHETKVTNDLTIFLRSWINRGIFDPGGLYDLKARSK